MIFISFFRREIVNNVILRLSAGMLRTLTLPSASFVPQFQGFLHNRVTEVCSQQNPSPAVCRAPI